MVLYRVWSGVITAMSVAKETKCGWRQHNNGFINRNPLRKPEWADIDKPYFTTDFEEAKQWSEIITSKLNDILQVAYASKIDVTDWYEDGADEESLPKSRMR